MAAISISRAELYRQIWEVPASKLASKYGLSDVGLAKICRRHNIPRPPRGYWTKLKHGHRPSKAKLPEPDQSELITFDEPKGCHSAQIRKILSKVPHYDGPLFELDYSFKDPHELIRATMHRPQSTCASKNLPVPQTFPLDWHVSDACMNRALAVLDVVFKLIEARGFEVFAGPEFHAFGVKVAFRISELTKVAYRKTPYGDRKYFAPTGRLELKITDVHRQSRIQHIWRDGKKGVEVKTEEFVECLIETAAYERQSQNLMERMERKWRHEEECRRHEEERRQVELRRREKLEQDASRWITSQQIRRYIAAVQEKYSAAHTVESISEWLTWASEIADEFDSTATFDPLQYLRPPESRRSPVPLRPEYP